MQILNIFNNIEKSLPILFIIRHTEGHLTNNPASNFQYVLIANGKKHANEQGKHFKNHSGNINKVTSSIVEKYIETGSKIIEGNGCGITVRKMEYLTKAYIYDLESDMIAFQDYTATQLVKIQLSGELLRCMGEPKEEGANTKRTRFILEYTDIPVYHLCLLAILYGILTKICLSKIEKEWFSDLEGICLQKNKEGYWMLYRSNSVFKVTNSTKKLQVVVN